MWIPTHYVCLIVAVLLGQSGVLFIYTMIGLLKSNPLPWVMPPPLPPPDLATCRMLLEGTQHVHGRVPHDSIQQLDTDTSAASTTMVTSTSTVLQTSTIKVSQTLPAGPESAAAESAAPESAAPSSQNTAITNIANNLKSVLGGDHTTMATATTTGSSATTSSGPASSATSDPAPPSSPSKSDPSKTENTGPSSSGGTSTANANIPTVTSVTYSTTLVGDPPKPRSTSTSVVVVTPGVNGHP